MIEKYSVENYRMISFKILLINNSVISVCSVVYNTVFRRGIWLILKK